MKPLRQDAPPLVPARVFCVECLDTQLCWVCSGSGSVPTRAGTDVCARCSGRSLCRACRPAPDGSSQG